MDIEKLAIEYQKGSQKAFNIIYNETLNMVRIAIYHYVQDKYIVEDLIQEVYMKLHLLINTYDSSNGKFENWLYTIAKNQALDYVKKKKPDRLDGAENLIPDKDISPYLRYVISTLNDEEREIFLLKVLGSYTTKSLSKIFNKPVFEINKIYKTAKEKLKKELTDKHEII